MRCLLLSVTALLMLSGLPGCSNRIATDGFTQNYEPVIRNGADSATVKKIPDPVRKRIERNDTLYYCETGWKDQLCESVKGK